MKRALNTHLWATDEEGGMGMQRKFVFSIGFDMFVYITDKGGEWQVQYDPIRSVSGGNSVDSGHH